MTKQQYLPMKITTFEIDYKTLTKIDQLILTSGCYCSRSDFIRAAVREYLLFLLEQSDDLPFAQTQVESPLVVQVPLGEGKFKQYHLIQK